MIQDVYYSQIGETDANEALDQLAESLSKLEGTTLGDDEKQGLLDYYTQWFLLATTR